MVNHMISCHVVDDEATRILGVTVRSVFEVSTEQKQFIKYRDFDTNNINKSNQLINAKKEIKQSSAMGKTSTCSNKNGKFNNRRPQNCIPKRPVACNFKTKSLQHKPPATKDRDYRTSPIVISIFIWEKS